MDDSKKEPMSEAVRGLVEIQRLVREHGNIYAGLKAEREKSEIEELTDMNAIEMYSSTTARYEK